MSSELRTAYDGGWMEINVQETLLNYAGRLSRGEMVPVLLGPDDNPRDLLIMIVEAMVEVDQQPEAPELPEAEGESLLSLSEMDDGGDTREFNIREFKIVHVERGETKGSQSPMWVLTDVNGEQLWAFQHHKPERNTWDIISKANYATLFDDMEVGQVQRWQRYPIRVNAIQDPNNNFYKISGIEPRPEDAKPDTPDSFWTQRRKDAKAIADAVTEGVIVDVETTGITDSDEVIEIACLNPFSGETFSSLVYSERDIHPKAFETHGLSLLQLKDAPTWSEVWEQMKHFLHVDVLIGHNIDFDIKMINQMNTLHDIDPIDKESYSKIVDTQDIMSKFIGDPKDEDRLLWQPLAESAAYLGVEVEESHRAGPDVRTTWKIIEALQKLEMPDTTMEDYRDMPSAHPF